MSGTVIARKNGSAYSSSIPGTEKKNQKLLGPLPFHEKLKKIDGLGSPEEAERMAIEIAGTDLEHRIIVGAFLLQVKEKGLYKPGTFSDWIMDNMGMQFRRAEYYMKVSNFVLRANIPDKKRARLNWSQCRVLASRIEPSDLMNWSDLASQARVPELEEFFKQNRSTDPRQFVEWAAHRRGGKWPPMVPTAAPNLPNEDADEEPIRRQLLTDIKDIFSGQDVDRIASNDLCNTLAKMENRPWPEWRHAKPITPTQLARLLGPYAVHPKCIRLTSKTTSKGYLLADFSDAFARYSCRQSTPEPKGATLQDLFRRTLKKHGNDESAAVATIIGELGEAFPRWTIHAEGPVKRIIHGWGFRFNHRAEFKDVENRLKKRPRTKGLKKMNGTPSPNYKPSSKEPFMNDKMQQYFRHKILIWRNQLQRKSKGIIQHLHEGGNLVPDTVDRASIEADRSLELRTSDRSRKLIVKIDEALDRIDNGTYGYCEVTDEPISLSRLELRPTATLSIEAQERHERMEKTQLSSNG